jgi:antitoxin Phd
MKKQVWQLQEARSKFSHVVDKALSDGPQIITRRGVEAAVILSSEEYAKLPKSQLRLLEFFRQSPLVGVQLDLGRDRSLPRELDL